jgi:hypothetical protein
MTRRQLERMGIYKDSTTLYPNRHWNEFTQAHLEIKHNDEMEDVVKEIYGSGLVKGIEEGKIIRSNEIRDLIHPKIIDKNLRGTILK